MKIVIIGAGEVGKYLAKGLSSEAKDVIIIDRNEAKLDAIREQLDVQTVHGDGSSLKVLQAAGAEDADILIAVTGSDEGNMMACVVARVYCQISRVIARIRNSEFTAPPILQKLSIDMAISPEKEAVENILNLLRIQDATEVLEFEGGKVLLIGYKIGQTSPLLGYQLKDLNSLRDNNILIVAIHRNELIQIPTGNDTIQAGDTVYTMLPQNQLENLKRIFLQEVRPVQNIMIIGGGFMGEYLAQRLEESELNVKLIDTNIARCHTLSENLKYAYVLHGDPTHIDFLMEENIDEMDACIAVSEDEQMNILVSLLAKRLGTPRIICSVTKSEYIPIATSIGIDSVISPRLSAASAMLRFIRQGRVLSVGTLRDDDAEAIEFVAEATSKIVNKPIFQVNFPKDAIIAAIIRDQEVIIPQGSDIIIPGDRVIIFTLMKAIKKVEKALQIKATR